jgi:hypothetical protein
MKVVSRNLIGILLLMAVAWWCLTLRHRPENLLIGEWKSNQELTSQAIRPFITDAPLDAQNKFLSIFGKMSIRYTDDTMHTIIPPTNGFPKEEKRLRYQVKKQTGREMVIVTDDGSFPGPVTIQFDSRDRYWPDIKMEGQTGLDTTGWRECFDRQR